MRRVISGKQYDTETAILIAHKKNKYLYKTFKGNFFLFVIILDNRNYLKPLPNEETAKRCFESMTKKVEWEVAFGESPEEA